MTPNIRGIPSLRGRPRKSIRQRERRRPGECSWGNRRWNAYVRRPGRPWVRIGRAESEREAWRIVLAWPVLAVDVLVLRASHGDPNQPCPADDDDDSDDAADFWPVEIGGDNGGA